MSSSSNRRRFKPRNRIEKEKNTNHVGDHEAGIHFIPGESIVTSGITKKIADRKESIAISKLDQQNVNSKEEKTKGTNILFLSSVNNASS